MRSPVLIARCLHVVLAVGCYGWATGGSGSLAVGAQLTAESLFDASRLHEIEIVIAPSDWDALRTQARGGGFMAAFANPTAKPFSYFPAEITVDGVRLPDVSIRKKGFLGSLDETRPSLKVKLGDQAVDSVVGFDRLTLNNNKQDPSQASQLLAYQTFNAAGIRAPRCSLTRVSVNGQSLGVYSNVESFRRPFLAERFGSAEGALYEGTLADFHPRSLAKFEAKTDIEAASSPYLKRLVRMLESADDLTLEQIESVVDVDAFLDFWALESLLGFWDGYTNNQNNFFIYRDPQNDKFYFMPWGADGCFTHGGGPFARMSGGRHAEALHVNAILPHRLYQIAGIPQRYQATMEKLLDKIWNVDELCGEVDRIERLTRDELHPEQVAAAGSAPMGMPALTSETVKQFIRGRAAQIRKELAETPLQIAERPRKPMYVLDVGEASGKFRTTWNHAEGDGNQAELDLKLDGEEVKLKQVTASARPLPSFGFGPPRGEGASEPPALIEIRGVRGKDERPVSLTLMVDRNVVADAHAQPFDVGGSFSEQNGWGFGMGMGGKMLAGSLTLDKAGFNDGDVLKGSFEATIFEMHGGMFERGDPPR
ncbi:MAG: CotH kinase family protein [Planctomycetales bacterium]|nr:CotH kinase family protein [Planctomycetales bacterium]